MSHFKRSLTLFLMRLPRAIAPVVQFGSKAFVFRDADVREILERDKDFTLAQCNGENISRHIGPFILGMDDGPRYQRDIGILRGIIHKEDPDRIRQFVRTTANQLLDDLSGDFDLIQSYTRLVPLKLVGNYFGTPGDNAADMLRWNRSLFWDVFLDLKDEPTIRANATLSAKEMNAYLDQLIQERKQVLNTGGRLPNDLLSRLLTRQQSDLPSFNDSEIRGNIAGVFLGALEPINKSVANVLNVFFERPKVLEMAREAAKADDVEQMGKLAWEALRFYPNAPALMRHTTTAQTIGGNGRKKRTIKAGKTVFVLSQSAMFDRRAVHRPTQFDPLREFSTYLYFGLGMHTCYGLYVCMIAIPEMLVALLKHENFRPAKGKLGKTQFEGPFPDKWNWESN